eukprot:4741774-Prymnesium_polylepis.2
MGWTHKLEVAQRPTPPRARTHTSSPVIVPVRCLRTVNKVESTHTTWPSCLSSAVRAAVSRTLAHVASSKMAHVSSA